MLLEGETLFICIDILSTPFIFVEIEGSLSKRTRLGAGCSAGLFVRAGGTSSSSSLKVKSTTGGGPLLREGVDDPRAERTNVDAFRGGAGGRDGGVCAMVSS